MSADRSELELAIRELHAVSYVAFGDDGESQPAVVQVVVTDPDRVEETVQRTRRILARHLGATDHRVDVHVAGAPRGSLAIQQELSTHPDVDEVVAVRGPRGDLVRLTLATGDERVAAELLERTNQAGIPAHRVEV